MRKTLSDGRIAQLKSKVNELKVLCRLLERGEIHFQVASREMSRVQSELYELSRTRGLD
jgi:hypothetical protein